VKRLTRDEKGQALIITLLLLVIGSIIITPTLNFMGAGIKAGRVYEQKIDEIYAADSGVEDALWHIRNDLVEDLLGTDYDEYDYSTPYDYPYVLDVNGKDVELTLKNIWIPKDIPDPSPPSPSEAKQIIEDEKLLIIGYPSSEESTYTIKIVYNWDTGLDDDLKVETIGIWLSPGFEYDGGCTLTGYSNQDISPYKGGQAVVWTFASQPLLIDFPPNTSTPTPNPLVKTFTFQYTGPKGQLPELVSSWIDTTGVTGITYSWDDSIRLYKIESQAGGVQIEAYGAKTKFRKLKSTISSDYTVTGNTLLEATGSEDNNRCTFPDSFHREKLYAERDGTVSRIAINELPDSGIAPPEKIPEESIIEDVYLYWSGWIDYHYWYEDEGDYFWGEITDLQYPEGPTEENLTILVETKAQVNKVKLNVGGTEPQTIYADKWQTARTDVSALEPRSWAYSCFADITDLAVSGNVTAREYIENAMKSAGSGTVAFTVGHADDVRNKARSGYPNYYFNLDGDGQTGYPLATPAHRWDDEECYEVRYNYTYVGWSLIIFYRSPALRQRQLYLYDDFKYIGAGGQPFTEEFSISGFLAPPVLSDEDKSHVTYFIGEGDPHFDRCRTKVNAKDLEDPPGNPKHNVFNSYSNAIADTDSDGIDIDTFELPKNCIMPYDTSADVRLITERVPQYHLAEGYTFVYLVLSFRSDLTTGGIITNYSVRVS
jgi:hypothetical protein